MQRVAGYHGRSAGLPPGTRQTSHMSSMRKKTRDPRERVLDAALALAQERSWEAVRLHEVARRAGLALEDVRRVFREKEEVADAWFDRADAALLARAAAGDLDSAALPVRITELLMAWFGALAPHRRVARQVLLGKLEPGHLHVQIPALLRVSRTVQWLREAAGRDVAGLARALEETALSAIFVAAVVTWLGDTSVDSVRTRRFVQRRVTEAQWLAWCWPGRAPRPSA